MSILDILYDILYKLYMSILFTLLQNFIGFANDIQYGARKGFQCIERVHCLRIILEKCHLWSISCILISLDVVKAYDRLRLTTIIRLLARYKVPLRLRYALLREIMSIKFVTFVHFGLVFGPIPVFRGLRQGSPESSFLFAIIVGDALNHLDSKWKQEGRGIKLGKWGGNDLAFSAFWDNFSLCFSKYSNLQSLQCTDFAFLDDM